MLFAVILVFLWAFAAPAATRLLGRHAGWGLALLPAGLTVWFAGFIPEVSEGRHLRQSVDWVPGIDVALSFQLDGLSLTFALLICGIGTFIVAYSGGYLKGDPHQPRFFLYILSFMGSMLGLVLADNLILLFVFWELTSVTSYLLIGYSHASPESRRAALQALLVTSLGGLTMMAGLVMLGIAGGSFEMSELAGQAEAFAGNALYLPVLVLVLAGCFTKSAQFPFHFWLPNAMEAPTPVSAYLHSATMVKAGVYLLARMNPILGGTEVWQVTLVAFGAVTALVGAVLAVRQTDLKRILAYTTVTALGQLVMLVGIGSTYAMEAFAAYLVAHALYKGALFMGAGAVDHETGTRDIRRLGGLAGAMPVTAAAIGLAALSNAGLPPFLGFIGKEFMYYGTLGLSGHGAMLAGILATAAMLVANALLLVTAGLVFLGPFLGARRETPRPPHEAPASLWLGPAVLAVLGLGLGLLHGWFEHGVVGPVAASLAGEPIHADIYLWGGFTTALGLSAATIALGVLLYAGRDRLKAALDRAAERLGYDSDRGYDRFMQGLAGFAAWQARVIQSGYLRHYLSVIFTVITVAVGATMFLRGGFEADIRFPREASAVHWALALIILAATLATTLASSRLVAILSLGVVGITISLVFLLFGAPDVAITQFMVETLVVIIVALVLSRLPDLTAFARPNSHRVLRDGAISLAFGAVVTLVMLAVIDLPIPLELSEFFVERSYVDAHGRNVVNVILVDFRALDTLGEITVVAVAGIGALAVLKAGQRHHPGTDGPRPLPESLILRTATRLLLSLMLLFSIFILLRGHNEPGGGFIGGLVAASAFALHSIAFGPEALRRLLAFNPVSIAATGIAAAILAGLLAAPFGDAFLTGEWLDIEGLALGTPLLFDIGVYLVVVGAVLTIVLALEEEEA
jgi:multicomponent Na+:H+ antiporter subunit A